MIIQRLYDSFDSAADLKTLKTQLDDEINNIITFINHILDESKDIIRGSGAPEGAVIANPGKLYVNLDGGTPTLYVKQTGIGTTGWVGK